MPFFIYAGDAVCELIEDACLLAFDASDSLLSRSFVTGGQTPSSTRRSNDICVDAAGTRLVDSGKTQRNDICVEAGTCLLSVLPSALLTPIKMSVPIALGSLAFAPQATALLSSTLLIGGYLAIRTKSAGFADDATSHVLLFTAVCRLSTLALDASGLLSIVAVIWRKGLLTVGLSPHAANLFCAGAGSAGMVAHHLQDLIAVPLWVWALEEKANCAPDRLYRSTTYAACGVAFQLLASISGADVRLAWTMLSLGSLCMGASWSEISGSITKAHSQQVQMGADFTKGYLLLSAGIQILGFSHSVDEQQMLQSYDILDAVCKLSGCHWLTKNRVAEEGNSVVPNASAD
eukprot:TRINITY_DN73081_c0_g1_i1.p1 TRINITY_DN73081_c0_g1~~TRINITY_DN73081_c0_g1_i1.p1  ORF type:complete len:347 (+),score=54.46 TRINITY_DN73081_c0_g1_i1:39-1079(+)